ncbi:MAG: hypothetical protein J5860_01270, partial [Clostridia bacterium]|nr:hypothetical protein [Clostridia bacterium]
MNRFIYKNAGSVSHRPKTPSISRFVSPWDTSGWYSVLPDFNVGKKVYSNSAATVASCDEKYKGADYIMTFNSAAEGFDDRQEVDFYVETDSVVTVFLDASEPLPEWAGDYKDTCDVAVLSNGAKYAALEREFPAETQVHIPGLKGDGNHFFVTVRPSEPCGETQKLAPLPRVENALGEYKKRTYESYVCETFNSSDALKNFAVSESVSLKVRDNDARDKYAHIDGTGFLHTKTAVDGEKVACSALVEPCSPEGTYAVCAFVGKDGENILGVFFDGGEIKAVTKSAVTKLADVVYGRQYAVKTVYDKAHGTCDVWLDCRLTASDLPSSGDAVEIGFYSTDGKLNVDDLKIYDDTEVFVADENGATLKKDNFVASKNAVTEKTSVPFEARSSVALSSSDGSGAGMVYEFPKISGVGTVETKVRPSRDDLAKISLVGEDGEAASVALYKNSLYVSDGAEWKQIYAGLTDWFYYPCDNFFLIKITFDTEGKTFDVWVDGACRAKGFALRSGSVYGVGYAVEGKTDLFIEKIRVYDDRDLCRGVIPNAPVFNVRDYGAVGDG